MRIRNTHTNICLQSETRFIDAKKTPSANKTKSVKGEIGVELITQRGFFRFYSSVKSRIFMANGSLRLEDESSEFRGNKFNHKD